MTYLDTHAVLWLYAGERERFSRSALDEIAVAQLLVSPAVLLEMALLQEIGRTRVDPEEVITVLRRDFGLAVCPLAFEDVVRTAYRENWTRDPFDRLIVAQTRATGGRLVSKDSRIRAAFESAIW